MQTARYFCLLFSSVFLVQAADGQPLRIGNQKQLLVDDHIIAKRTNLRRVLHPAKKVNQGKPIFTDGLFYGTVLHDQGKFKMWWRKPGKKGFGYAESANGLQFKKVADVRGINFAGDYTLSVTIDQHETDPRHRYKAAYDAPGMRAGIAHSADGKNWIPYNRGMPVTYRAADTYNQILWDPLAKTYRLLTRTDFGTAGGAGEVRGHRTMVNKDPKRNPMGWKTIKNWIFDREGKKEIHRRQIYSVTHWIYEGVHFGLLFVYEWPGDVSEGPFNPQRRPERDVLNYYIGTSRNGKDWDLQWVYKGQPIIVRGPGGSFDCGMISPSSSIITHKDEHWLYYGGSNERHGTPKVVFNRKQSIGLAKLRLDGFISLRAGRRPGQFFTKPILWEGKELQLNVAAPQGTVKVEIIRQGRIAVAAEFARVDRKRLTVLGNLSSLRGKVVQMRITLHRADLYALQVVK